MLERRIAFDAEQDAEVGASQREEFLRRQSGQLRIPLPTDVARQRQVPCGGAVGEQRRREDGAEDFESLDSRNQHAEACARMRHILAAESEHDAGHRRIADFREGSEMQRRQRLDFQFRQPESGAGVDHRAVRGARLPGRLAEVEQPTVGCLGEPGDGSVQADGLAQIVAQSVRQNLQTGIKGKLWGAVLGDFAALLALASAEDLPLDERAVARFELAQLREGLRHGKLVGIARIDPGHERVNGVVQKFLPQPAHNEFRDAFLFAIAARRHKRLAQHRELGPGGKELRREKAQRRPRHGDGPLVADNITRLSLRIGIEPARGQARIANQLADPG